MTLLTHIQTLSNLLQLIQKNNDIADKHPDIVEPFTADPTEHFDIADEHPDIVQSFTADPTEH